jgi:hypothetical protein
MPRNALIVVTSRNRLGETGRPTGFYFDEMAAPYWALMDAGYAVDIASIKGGSAPYDPGSYGETGKRPAAVQRFIDDAASMEKLAATRPVASINARDYAAVFLPGGHGTMWDFTDRELAELVGGMWDLGALGMHQRGRTVANRADGQPLVGVARQQLYRCRGGRGLSERCRAVSARN